MNTATGRAHRSTGGSPPKGLSLGTIIALSAEQAGRPIPIAIQYDKAIWSGLSWAVGEIAVAALQGDAPVMIKAITTETANVRMEIELYGVEY
jgi:hypothetical protein